MILQSSIYDYSEAYMLVSGTITVTALAVGGSNNSIQLVFKNYAQFNYCMIWINNTQIDNAKDIDVAMPMHNLIESSDNYSKIFGNLWQYYIHQPVLTDAGIPDNFPSNSFSCKLKEKIPDTVGTDSEKNVQIMVSLEF